MEFHEQTAKLGDMIKSANIDLLKGATEPAADTTIKPIGIPKLNKSKNPKYVSDMKDNSPYHVK